MRQTHRDIRNWIQVTATYQTQDGITGMDIPRIKTQLVLRWRQKRNEAMQRCQDIRAEINALPRTKSGSVYKRHLTKLDELKHQLELHKEELKKQDKKYWLARKREADMSHEPVFKMLFCLWNSYDKLEQGA